MNKIYCCILFFGVSTFSFAQNSGNIYGTVMDTVLKQTIPEVTITILDGKDSSLITFGRTSKTGVFNIRYLPKGQYRLLATHIGYRNYSSSFEITDNNKEINAGYIIMNSKVSSLEEVTVVQEKAPVIIRNDTVEFNAGSFKTKPNAVVEDLLKKLPGVQIDKDGKIKANGEEVKKILVDGKEFFGNDPKIASKNLAAEVVDKVQVFDRKSDQSQFTGFDDGNSEKTINLTIKQDKKKGVFGRASSGVGNYNRYQANANINLFRGDKQLSILGMANNTNKLGFSFIDLLSFTGGLEPTPGGRGGGMVDLNSSGVPLQSPGSDNSAVSTTWAGGLNFNDNWSKNLSVNGSYFFNRIEDVIDQRSYRQYLLQNNSFSRLQDASITKRNENHRFNISVDYAIDSVNSVKLSSTANIQNSIAKSENVYHSVSEKGYELNKGYSSTVSKGDGYSWKNNLLWRHKFGKKGRTFSANLLMNFDEANNSNKLNSRNSFYGPDGINISSDTLDQISDQRNDGLNYGVTLSYTEPLSKRTLVEGSYSFNETINGSEKGTFNIDQITGKYNLRNELLSNDFDNQYTYHRAGINWRYQQKKINFSAGSFFQRSSLESKFLFLAKDSMIAQSFLNFLPNARMQYKINKYKSFRLNYNTYTLQPSAWQLNPIIDNSDPLNIRIGNTELFPEFNHRMQLSYMTFDPFRHTSFFSMLNFIARQNGIVNDDYINAQGVRTSRMVNTNGLYSLNMVLSWGLPIKKLKSNLNLNTDVSQSQTANFINGQRNTILINRINQQVNLSFIHKEILDITGGANVSYNRVRYSITPGQNTGYWNQEYTLDGNLYLPKGFSFASEFTFSRNIGYTSGYNMNVALWNCGVGKQLFKNKKGEVKLQLFDILNENAGISRNANQNYIEDVYSKVLNRYLLLSFTYNISRFAGKGAPVQKGGNIKVIGDRNRM